MKRTRDEFDLPTGNLMFKVNGEWQSFAHTDGETEASIRRMNERYFHLPEGTECLYTGFGRPLQFTL